MSRLAQARPAVRPSLKARLMLSGPPGAGKTWTALELAQTLGDRTLVIDTEKESALTYADDFTFEHLPWAAPFDPLELQRNLIDASMEYDTVIVDSFSHFWTGEGGTLAIADGKFGGWKVARPAQVDVVDGILSCSAHVIVCVRAKIEYAQEETVDGGRRKQTVRKLGMAPQQDSMLEYELNLAADLDIEHRLSISKSRTTAVPVGKTFAPGHARDLGKLYADWLASGEAFADLEVRARIDADRRALTDDQKKDLWAAWQAQGLPRNVELLTESQAAMAVSLLEAVTETKIEVPA